MDKFIIQGGNRLKGTVRVGGSKNASLPLLAAALLTDEPVTLHEVPDLSDTRNMYKLLGELGCETSPDGKGSVGLKVVSEENSRADYDIVVTMRASVCVLGPLLAKRGHAILSMPGGCAIGYRPIDLHLRGLAALGAEIDLTGGDIHVKAKKLRGKRVFLGGPFGSTVLGTANVMCAATLAEGRTIIEQAACEPEIVDLANLLRAMGAKITGDGTPRLIVEGVEKLKGADYRIMPDRIEAATLMIASAITNGDIRIDNCPLDALSAVVDHLHRVGVEIEQIDEKEDPLVTSVQVSSSRRLEPLETTTQPHPGFPTDVQAQLLALLTLADGNSVITEKIFPERFLHVAELARMGADLYREGPTVMIHGVRKLEGAIVMASDLRASAGLVLAGLAARGQTTINRIYHLDRGYDKMELKLQALGADIERVKE